MRVLAGVVVLTLGPGVGGAWAIAKITVARDGSRPRTLEIRAGEAVQFINTSGSTAHVWFGNNDSRDGRQGSLPHREDRREVGRRPRLTGA